MSQEEAGPAHQSRNALDENLQASSLHPRLAWIMVYYETGSAEQVCSRFGISRKTLYKWVRRYEQANGDASSLTDLSRRPHRFPRATPPEKIELLQQAKEATGFGQRRLRVYLEENYHISLSERTIWKILKRNSAASTPAEA